MYYQISYFVIKRLHIDVKSFLTFFLKIGVLGIIFQLHRREIVEGFFSNLNDYRIVNI